MRERSHEVGHRRFVRLPVVLPVVGRAAQFGATEVPGTVWNIGGGGLLAKFPVRIVPGSAVALVLQTRRGGLAVTGVVAWADPPARRIRHGIAFRDPRGDAFASELFHSENC